MNLPSRTAILLKKCGSFDDPGEDESSLRLVLYEIKFEGDTPCLVLTGSLPMTYGHSQASSIGPFFAFSPCGQRIALAYGSTAVIWDFMSNTHAAWSPSHLGHPLPLHLIEVFQIYVCG
jgi:hypothetical protein